MTPFQAHFVCSSLGVQRVILKSSSDDRISWSTDGASGDLIRSIDCWMEGYIAGKEHLELPPLDWPATAPFINEVLHLMQAVPRGKVVTYSELAAPAGRPKAARAVGQACARNPFPLLIPCHRVVAVQGLGGFLFGLKMKEQMLAFEGWHASRI